MTNNEIQFKIGTLRMQIFALECGHDFLSRDDNAQIVAWNAEINALQSQMTEVA